jgi:hypothetical protein
MLCKSEYQFPLRELELQLHCRQNHARILEAQLNWLRENHRCVVMTDNVCEVPHSHYLSFTLTYRGNPALLQQTLNSLRYHDCTISGEVVNNEPLNERAMRTLGINHLGLPLNVAAKIPASITTFEDLRAFLTSPEAYEEVQRVTSEYFLQVGFPLPPSLAR